MEPHDVPDVPPPPYSETDIYSVSHHSYNNNNNDNINPLLRSDSGNHSHNVLDDAFSVAPSSSYSNPVIYTPPDSPSEASQHHQNTVLGDPPALSSFSSQSQNSNSAPIRTTPSAQSYFASRAVARQPNQALVTSYLSLTPESLPSDFPYPRDWAIGHAVTEQDWQTFLNHALPGHAARVDEVIVDRKIGIAASAASAASVAGDDLSVRGGHHDAKSSTGPGETGLSSASTAAGSGILGLGSGSGWSVKDIDAAIREWNQGFFGPRGITILRSEAAGSSSSSRGRQSLERERQQQQRDLAQQVEQQQQAQSSTPWWRTLVSMATEIATAPHQDRGPMAARMLSQHAFGSAIEERGGGRSRGRGRGRGQDFDGRWWYGQQQDPHHHSHDLHHDHRHDHDHHDSHSHSGPTKNIRRRRSRSSSTSSSSSSSSSSSDSSVGSLPDWDDLKDSQLPTARATVSAWLSHPDQPITKEAIKQAKASIKAAKNNNPPLGPATSTSTSVGSGVVVASNEDQARLRREVRQLMTDFKALKRSQRDVKRAARRSRRDQKRAEKQQRRSEKLARKQSRRERRRAEKRDGRHGSRRDRDHDDECGIGGRHQHQQAHVHVQGFGPHGHPGHHGPGGPGPFGPQAAVFGRGPGFGRRGFERRGGRLPEMPVAGGITGFGFPARGGLGHGGWMSGWGGGPSHPFSPSHPHASPHEEGRAPVAASSTSSSQTQTQPTPDPTALRQQIQSLEARMRSKADEISIVAQQNAREVVEAAKRGQGDAKTERGREAEALRRLEDLETEMNELSLEFDRLTHVQEESEVRSRSRSQGQSQAAASGSRGWFGRR